MTNPALSIPTPNGRFYAHPRRTGQVAGKPSATPSITNIIGKKDKKAIPYWAARQCGEFAADNLTTLNTLTRDGVIDLVRTSPWRTSSTAAEVGSIVHDAIDQWIKGSGDTGPDMSEWPTTAKQMWRQWLGLVNKYDPDFIASEFTVWSDRYGYAGTGDWAAFIGGVLVLADTKTGKGVYPEVGMQLAALANADFILADDGSETPIPKYERFAVAHVRPRSAKLIPVERIDECFKAFVALREVFDFDVNTAAEVLKWAPKVETRNEAA